MLRPVAKFAPANVHLARGLEEVDAGLAALGVGAESREDELPLHTAQAAAPLVRLHAALLASRSRAWLAQTELARGRRDAAAALAVAAAWPVATAPVAPVLRATASHYALLTRELGPARAGFAALATAGGNTTGPAPPAAAAAAAGALSALAELADHDNDAGGGPTARAVAALKAGGAYPTAPTAVPRYHRTLAQLALGATLARSEDGPGARRALASAVKGAQLAVVDFQLLTHALAAMAPVQADTGDVDGGRQMVASAVTLARETRDGVALLAAASVWTPTDAQAEEAAAWCAKKRREVEDAVEEAMAEGGEHAGVVAYAERGA